MSYIKSKVDEHGNYTLDFFVENVIAYVYEREIKLYFKSNLEYLIFSISRDGTMNSGFVNPSSREHEYKIGSVVQTLKNLGFKFR